MSKTSRPPDRPAGEPPVARRPYTLEKIPFDALCIDPSYQRDQQEAWIAAHLPVFDLNKVGLPVVNRRTDGRYYVVDGQQRIELVKRWLGGDLNGQCIDCRLYQDLSAEEEADEFVGENDRTGMSPLALFRGSLKAGHAEARAIHAIVEAAGLHVGRDKEEGEIAAVAALRWVYRGCKPVAPTRGPKILADVLGTIIAAWGRESGNFVATIITGLGAVYASYAGQLDKPKLATVLAKVEGGREGILAQARMLREAHRGNWTKAVGGAIVGAYNYRLEPKRKLTGWWA